MDRRACEEFAVQASAYVTPDAPIFGFVIGIVFSAIIVTLYHWSNGE